MPGIDDKDPEMAKNTTTTANAPKKTARTKGATTASISGASAVPASATPTAPAKPNPVPASKPRPTHAEIAKRAFEIWVRKGRPVGRDLENWNDAERELGLKA